MSVPYNPQPFQPRKVNFGWIGESWQFFGQAAGIWIVAILLYGIVSNVVQEALKFSFPNSGYVSPPSPFGIHYDLGVHYGTNSDMTPLGQVLSALFTWVFGAFQSASLYRMAVKQVRGEAVSFGDIIGGSSFFGNMLIFNLFIFLSALVGTLALCIGIFFVMGLLLPGPALVADGESSTNAFSRSIDAMKQDWLTAGLFAFVFVLLMLVSVVPCGLGLFVTTPMLHLVSALAYRDMIGMPNMNTGGGYGFDAPQPGVWPPPPTGL